MWQVHAQFRFGDLRSGEIDIYVIRGNATDEATDSPRAPATADRTPLDRPGYFIAAAIVVVTTSIGWPLNHRLDVSNENILMLYLLGVLWAATHYSRGAAIFASILSVAAYDLIFVPPYYTLAVSDFTAANQGTSENLRTTGLAFPGDAGLLREAARRYLDPASLDVFVFGPARYLVGELGVLGKLRVYRVVDRD